MGTLQISKTKFYLRKSFEKKYIHKKKFYEILSIKN